MFKSRIAVFFAVAIIIVLLVLAGYFFWATRQGKPSPTPIVSGNNELPFKNSIPFTNQATSSAIGDFKGLVTAAGPYIACTFASSTHSGNLYANGTKATLGYINLTENKTYHVFVDGADAYVWSDGDSGGYKTTKDMIFSASPDKSLLPLGGLDPAGRIDFSCEEKKFTDAVFDLPEGMTFANFGIQ